MGPLQGVRILDFTRLLPGPFGTMMLADLGAQVVRVEAPNLPDLLRVMPPLDGEVSAIHRQVNRNKLSLVLDLKHPRGPEVVKRLVKHFDVVMEQFRPGVMDRLGVGYTDLKSLNPRLIYCAITGYGQDGPYRDRAGHDINYLALSGIMSYTGRKGQGPLPLGIQVADQCAGGLNAVIGVLAALFHRERTGEGQFVDISMTDGAIHLGSVFGMAALFSGRDPGRESLPLNGGGYYDFYETSDGEFMAVGSLEPQFFRALCQALGREDLIARQLAGGSEGERLKEELKAEFKKKSRAEWEKIFGRCDACVEPVLTVSEMAGHPHTQARGMIVEVPRDKGTPQKQIACPLKFSGTAPEYRFAGVAPGTHTDEVLAAGGFSENEIKSLRNDKVVK